MTVGPKLIGAGPRRIRDATEQLDRAITAATTTGRFIPCLGRDEWLSEDYRARAQAAAACHQTQTATAA